MAAGDSFNDVGMLQQADIGIFFKAPESITVQFPDIDAVDEYTHTCKTDCDRV